MGIMCPLAAPPPHVPGEKVWWADLCPTLPGREEGGFGFSSGTLQPKGTLEAIKTSNAGPLQPHGKAKGGTNENLYETLREQPLQAVSYI